MNIWKIESFLGICKVPEGEDESSKYEKERKVVPFHFLNLRVSGHCR